MQKSFLHNQSLSSALVIFFFHHSFLDAYISVDLIHFFAQVPFLAENFSASAPTVAQFAVLSKTFAEALPLQPKLVEQATLGSKLHLGQVAS